MPLLDHFHPPLSVRRHWESFHGFWASAVAAWLNAGRLPPGFFAEMQLHVGSRVEVDVGTFNERTENSNGETTPSSPPSGGTATFTTAPTWSPPIPAATVETVFPDELEVQVFHEEGGAVLVAALEFVSPSNKDRPATRQAFVTKCASYLQQGIGLILVDIVTNLHANLHNELLRFLGDADAGSIADEATPYTAAYRPARRKSGDEIDVWPHALQIGQPLPTVPLALRGYECVRVDLEACYLEALRHLRLE